MSNMAFDSWNVNRTLYWIVPFNKWDTRIKKLLVGVYFSQEKQVLWIQGFLFNKLHQFTEMLNFLYLQGKVVQFSKICIDYINYILLFLLSWFDINCICVFVYKDFELLDILHINQLVSHVMTENHFRWVIPNLVNRFSNLLTII